MSGICCAISTGAVALLAEGVDRNCAKQYRQPCEQVALLAEGVDRNFELVELHLGNVGGRPPRGGRG